MDLEQLAILGIIIFGFMAVVHMFNTVRTFKRTMGRSRMQRVRRLVGGTESARAVAMSVVREVAEKHPEEVERSRQQGGPTEEIGEALDKARAYYLGRVEPRHRGIFSEAVDEIILGKEKDEDHE